MRKKGYKETWAKYHRERYQRNRKRKSASETEKEINRQMTARGMMRKEAIDMIESDNKA